MTQEEMEQRIIRLENTLMRINSLLIESLNNFEKFLGQYSVTEKTINERLAKLESESGEDTAFGPPEQFMS